MGGGGHGGFQQGAWNFKSNIDPEELFRSENTDKSSVPDPHLSTFNFDLIFFTDNSFSMSTFFQVGLLDQIFPTPKNS